MAKWRAPFKRITAHYGEMSEFRRKNKMQAHSGTDWAAPAGTLIPAITDGTIRLISYSTVLGWCVEQTGWDHKRRRTVYVGYAHLFCEAHGAECGGPRTGCKNPFPVRKGQKVKAGEKFGIKVGNSGTATSGAHLHATLGSRPRAIFAATSAKQDLYKFIQEQTSFLAGQQEDKKTPAVVLPEVKRCPTCKQPIEN